ncbi:hypothetical protein Aglo03_41090 [Actinokineospora globicatena]|uniref:Uncharacterized protein n=1 Tax=Actinokineospora globicatena TaxID=103729 RepID=A0A9W6QMU0_9PSEU|nr:hypothetical protein Aglo03_41090 [Actinokineospora globicatena]
MAHSPTPGHSTEAVTRVHRFPHTRYTVRDARVPIPARAISQPASATPPPGKRDDARRELSQIGWLWVKLKKGGLRLTGWAIA